MEAITDSDAIEARVREALELRRALLPNLADPSMTHWPTAELTATSARAWTLFLRAECCAIALGSLLREHRLLATLPAATREVVERAEITELQRVLAARESLRRMEVASCRLGITGIVFKGGVAAAEQGRRAVDLADIDLIVSGDDIPLLWAALLEEGWRASDLPFTPSSDEVLARPQLPPLVPPGAGLPVEIHRAIPYATVSRGIDRGELSSMIGFTALRRLRGVAAFTMLLRHSVVQHPPRRGHVRDMLLLADELSLDPSLTETSVAQAIVGDPYESELRETLDQVVSFRAGRGPRASPGVLSFVAWKYEFVLRQEAPMRRFAMERLSLSHLALERPAIRRARLRGELREARQQDSLDSRIRGERYGPLVPGFMLRAARWLYRALLVASVIATGSFRRRRARRLIASLLDRSGDVRSTSARTPLKS